MKKKMDKKEVLLRAKYFETACEILKQKEIVQISGRSLKKPRAQSPIGPNAEYIALSKGGAVNITVYDSDIFLTFRSQFLAYQVLNLDVSNATKIFKMPPKFLAKNINDAVVEDILKPFADYLDEIEVKPYQITQTLITVEQLNQTHRYDLSNREAMGEQIKIQGFDQEKAAHLMARAASLKNKRTAESDYTGTLSYIGNLPSFDAYRAFVCWLDANPNADTSKVLDFNQNKVDILDKKDNCESDQKEQSFKI